MATKKTRENKGRKPNGNHLSRRLHRENERKKPLDALLDDIAMGNLRIFSQWLARYGSWENFLSNLGARKAR